jgi:hypothetical protein
VFGKSKKNKGEMEAMLEWDLDPQSNVSQVPVQQTQIQQMMQPQQASQQPMSQQIPARQTTSREFSKKVKENAVNPFIDYFTADPNKQKVLASTQDHLDIYDIRDNCMLLKNGDVSLIVETTAVNFQLLSSFEQDMKIQAFSQLINSLNFELQIVIHTEPIDMRRYLTYLEESYKKISREPLQKQMRLYIEFVKQLVVQNNILQKRFFVIIPHRSGMLTADQVNPFQKLVDVVAGRKRVTELKEADKIVEKALIQLIPKRDHIMKMLSRMGLGSKQLSNKELIQLFYSYYNPVEHF